METDADNHSQTLGGVRETLQKRGKKDYRTQSGPGHHENMAHRVHLAGLIGTHRD